MGFDRKVKKNKYKVCIRCAHPCGCYLGAACIYAGGTINPHEVMNKVCIKEST